MEPLNAAPAPIVRYRSSKVLLIARGGGEQTDGVEHGLGAGVLRVDVGDGGDLGAVDPHRDESGRVVQERLHLDVDVRVDRDDTRRRCNERRAARTGDLDLDLTGGQHHEVEVRGDATVGFEPEHCPAAGGVGDPVGEPDRQVAGLVERRDRVTEEVRPGDTGRPGTVTGAGGNDRARPGDRPTVGGEVVERFHQHVDGGHRDDRRRHDPDGGHARDRRSLPTRWWRFS